MMMHAFKIRPLALAIAVAATLGSVYLPQASAVVIDDTQTGQPVIGIHEDTFLDTIDVHNTGRIEGLMTGIDNRGTIDTINNEGTITSGRNVIINLPTGSIGTINNMGRIVTEQGYAIMNNGHIGVINNSGIIETTGNTAIIHAGTSTLDEINNSGLIRSPVAISVYGPLGKLTNSGTIEGWLDIRSPLTVIGGMSNIGTLTGYSTDGNPTVGRLMMFNGDLDFAGGNTLLNDHVQIYDGYKVLNSGANLYLSGPVTINDTMDTGPTRYEQSERASLNIIVSNDVSANTGNVESGYGRLNVNGSVYLAPGSSVNLINHGYSLAPGQRYVVIDASDGLNTDYNESRLHYNTTARDVRVGGQSVFSDGHKLLVLNLAESLQDNSGSEPNLPPENNGGTTTPPDTTTPPVNGNTGSGTPPVVTAPDVVRSPIATRANAVSSMTGLQNYTGIANAALLNLYNASLAIGSKAEANKAGEQLSPVINTGAGQAASTATFDMLNVIGARMDAVRLAQAYGQSESGIATGDSMVDSAVWGQLFGGRARQSTTSEMSGYKANYGGFVLGADHDITDAWRLGGAVSYTATNVDGRNYLGGTDADVNAWGLTAYANYQAESWYTSLYATAVTQRYSTQRSVAFTGYTGSANGKFNGQQYALKAEAGLPLALTKSVTFTPLANLSYSYLNQEGYTESNGNGAALKVDAAHSDTIKSGLGAKLQTVTHTPLGQVAPYVQAMWYHQYDAKAMNVSAAYAAATDETGFTSRGMTPEKDSVGGRAGVTLVSSGTRSVDAYYDITAAPHYTNQSVSLQFKQQF